MSPKLLIDDHFDIIECHVGGKIKHYKRGPMGCAPYIGLRLGGICVASLLHFNAKERPVFPGEAHHAE